MTVKYKQDTHPDLTQLQDEFISILSPLGEKADLYIQFPFDEFDVSKTKPTITVGIKNIFLYSTYQQLRKTSPYPVNLTAKATIYIPKNCDNAIGYDLFNELAGLLFKSKLAIERISCDEMQYDPELLHHYLKVDVVLKPFEIEEIINGDTNL